MSAQVLWVGLVGKYLECLWRQITALPWWNSSKIINIQYMAKFPLWELVPYQGFNSGPLCWQTGHSEVAKARSAFMQREPMLLVSHVISIAWPGPPVQSTLASVRCLQGKVHICYTRGPLSIDCWGLRTPSEVNALWLALMWSTIPSFSVHPHSSAQGLLVTNLLSSHCPRIRSEYQAIAPSIC